MEGGVLCGADEADKNTLLSRPTHPLAARTDEHEVDFVLTIATQRIPP
jgi:hypothetical protein